MNKMGSSKRYVPGQVVWETTLRCNLKCIHCGSSAGKSRIKELTTKEALKVCNDLALLKTEGVCLMGGEPLLRKDWHIIAKQIRDLDMKFLIISNGFTVNNDIILKLTRLEPYSVSTSLDGSTAKTHDYIRGVNGSFKKVKEYISLSKKAGLPVTIITTVSKINFHELPKIRDMILNKQIAWQIQVGTPSGRFSRKFALSKEEYYSVALFIAQMKKNFSNKEMPVAAAHCFGYHSNCLPALGLAQGWDGCQAGISILSIKSNGDVTGCLAIPDSKIEGNVRSKSIVDIWNNPISFSYNRNFNEKNLGENCKDCKYGNTCRGGCIGLSSGFTGKYYNHPYCFYKIESELLKK